MSHTSFVIPKYLIPSDAVIGGIVFLISFLDCSLLVYRKKPHWSLYPAATLNFLEHHFTSVCTQSFHCDRHATCRGVEKLMIQQASVMVTGLSPAMLRRTLSGSCAHSGAGIECPLCARHSWEPRVFRQERSKWGNFGLGKISAKKIKQGNGLQSDCVLLRGFFFFFFN